MPRKIAFTLLLLALLLTTFGVVMVDAQGPRPRTPVTPETTITVNTLLDTVATDGLCSLREAIQSANAGMPIGNCASGSVGRDTINITATGTIVLGSLLPDITQDVDIAGPGAELITLSGNHAYRVLKANTGVKVNLSAVTIADGFAAVTGGGGLLNSGTMTITDSTIFNNLASTVNGGGIYNDGALTLSHSAVYSNSSTLSGGGIYDSGPGSLVGTLVILNSDVYSNVAGNTGAGGIMVYYGASTISDSNIFGNDTAGYGGGLYIFSSTLDVANSSFNSNTGVRGGGLYTTYTNTVNISNSTFFDNHAVLFNGGGIDLADFGTQNVTLTNTTFLSNTSKTTGGGIFVTTSATTLNVINSTLAANNGSDGGNIYRNLGVVILKNTIVVNSPTTGNCAGTITDGGNNLQFGGTAANSCGATITTADPRLAPLANYGGATKTMALYFGSAAINAGNPATCAPTDQRGVARPIGPACDIGAFEGALPALFLPFIAR